ncbi:hypothetical protein ABZ645_25625 [Nocardiopsis alba]|uniref:hypothetical protein n=1 Tax=Nocardiopsis alba TaxID=53437 RepID=UPI0033BC525A
MKFEFIEDESSEHRHTTTGHEGAQGTEDEQPTPLSPSALIAAASERLLSRTFTDVHRARASLNRMQYAVQASPSWTESTFESTSPEPEPATFRPSAFGPRPQEDGS